MVILSFIAALFTTISFIPQAVQVIKTKNTSGISLSMYLILTTGVLLWTIYGFYIKDIAIASANLITFVFASIILKYKIIEIIKYK